MATATTRSKTNAPTSRKQSSRASKARSNGSAGRTAATSAARSGRASKARSQGANRSGATSSAASRTRGRTPSESSSASNGSSHNGASAAREAVENMGDVAKQVGLSVATGTLGAAAGIAGGVLLGRTAAAKRPRKVLGVKLPTQHKADFSALSQFAKSINEAGKQVGKLAGEVREARQKAEEIGKALG